MNMVEVAIPLVVYVDADGDSPRVIAWEVDGDWGGYHSEAESGEGVWDSVNDTWGHERQSELADAARLWLRAFLPGGSKGHNA